MNDPISWEYHAGGRIGAGEVLLFLLSIICIGLAQIYFRDEGNLWPVCAML